MNSRFTRFFSIFFVYVFLCSGSSVSYKSPPQEIHPKQKQNIGVLFAPTISTSILDGVPIVNPTPPGSTITPTSPSTEPISNPTTPVTTPTSPDTNPSPTISTPTSPDTNPSPTVSTPTSPDTNPTPTMTPPTVPTTTPSTTGGSWCVANQGASPTALQIALDYACGYGGSDCSAIQTGGSCYEPNTIQNHASYAFNDYYQKHRDPTSCVFGGAAQLTNTDPSTGNCHYAASSSTGASPPATMSPPSTTTMAPPFSMTPPAFTVPGGDTVYGSAEPTGLPNSAISVSFQFWPIYLAISLVWSLVAAHIV
ncbi:hypothetical protein HRI_004497400 [Hibiscus trionum]|uniref:X8 domain-containing protein n=1 Tax=Hibiscus trionum TaxID=183268 RepID=A0A9W7J7X6_HIBTR|nr:hypothetical protein HRI_004497400 [Hibiscus trionum]